MRHVEMIEFNEIQRLAGAKEAEPPARHMPSRVMVPVL
jgi:hypothetical protein